MLFTHERKAEQTKPTRPKKHSPKEIRRTETWYAIVRSGANFIFQGSPFVNQLIKENLSPNNKKKNMELKRSLLVVDFAYQCAIHS